MTAVGACSVGGLDVSRETFGALKAYEALVQRWTSAVNLVSKADAELIWPRHIEDSAQILAFCPPNAKTWLDLGSGGGFPGLVVAILARERIPGLRLTLVESDLRKATFLKQAAQSLNLDLSVLSRRIESLEPFEADVLSARALASLAVLLGYAHTHLAPAGVAVFPKGARASEEIAEARKTWTFDVDRVQSRTDAKAEILVIRNIHRAQDE